MNMKDLKWITGSGQALLTSVKEWFSRNILLKTTSLVLGLFLWFHAITDQAHQMAYPVPLELVLSDSTLVIVNDLPPTIEVLFAGTGKELLKLWWYKPNYVKEIDIDEVGVKDINLDVSSLSMPAEVNLIPLGVKFPAALHVTLDRVVEKKVRVVSNLKVIPGEEYVVVGNVSVEPSSVTLKGARGELSGIDAVKTVGKTVEGVTDSFSTAVKLDLSNFRNVASEITEVTVSGRVEKYVEFELSEIPIRLRGRLKDKFVVQPGYIGLVIIGPVSRIQSLNKDEIDVYIEINDPPVGETYYSPMIDLPLGVELLSEQPKLFKAVPIDQANSTPAGGITRAAFRPGRWGP